MYDYLKGIPTDKRKDSKGFFITIEVAGIGYLLEVTEGDFFNASLIDTNPIKFYTSLIHKEDSMNLIGFTNKDARDIFQILISVSGVGAKMALALLNEFDVCNLISFVIDENFKELTRAKGVGTKLAQKIILELKDKLIKTNIQQITCTTPHSPAIADAEAIMISLGYDENEIKNALTQAMSNIDDTLNTEEILRKALTCLSL